MRNVQFRLLGPVELVVDQRLVSLGPPKQRAVIAALLVDAGTPLSPDALIDRVWGHAPPPEARNTLQSHIARIRGTLDQVGGGSPPAVMLDRRSGCYVLNLDRELVDLFQFQRLVDTARAEGVMGERAARLQEAIGLWRGEPLEGVTGAWADLTRAALAEQMIRALVLWTDLELQMGHYDPVIERLTPYVLAHPLVEPLIAVLMRALFLAGRASEALSCYARARLNLAEELGTEPGLELSQVHRAILRGELRPAQPGKPAYRVGGRTPHQLPSDVPAFTGRLAELQLLDEAAAAAPRRTIAITAVSGTAGVGKTTHGFLCGTLWT